MNELARSLRPSGLDPTPVPALLPREEYERIRQTLDVPEEDNPETVAAASRRATARSTASPRRSATTASPRRSGSDISERRATSPRRSATNEEPSIVERTITRRTIRDQNGEPETIVTSTKRVDGEVVEENVVVEEPAATKRTVTRRSVERPADLPLPPNPDDIINRPATRLLATGSPPGTSRSARAAAVATSAVAAPVVATEALSVEPAASERQRLIEKISSIAPDGTSTRPPTIASRRSVAEARRSAVEEAVSERRSALAEAVAERRASERRSATGLVLDDEAIEELRQSSRPASRRSAERIVDEEPRLSPRAMSRRRTEEVVEEDIPRTLSRRRTDEAGMLRTPGATARAAAGREAADLLRERRESALTRAKLQRGLAGRSDVKTAEGRFLKNVEDLFLETSRMLVIPASENDEVQWDMYPSREAYREIVATFDNAEQATPDEFKPEKGGKAVWKDVGRFKKIMVSDRPHLHLFPVPHADVVNLEYELPLDARTAKKLHKFTDEAVYNPASQSLWISTTNFASGVVLLAIIRLFAAGKLSCVEAHDALKYWRTAANENHEFYNNIVDYVQSDD